MVSRRGSVERLVYVTVAGCILSGCGGSGAAPLGASRSAAQTAEGDARAHGRRSWIIPKATSGNLVYASNSDSEYGPAVYVYSYPKGELVGKLTDFASGYYPQGLCADSSGDVFVTTNQGTKNPSQSNIYEYAHGGTSPI